MRTFTTEIQPAETASTPDWRQLKAENEALRAQLKLATRQASMAEVASNALHNVGNVINSINVSVSVIGNQLRQSRLQNLSKTLLLLRQHKDALGQFLTTDPKGKLVPSYLETLSDHLAAENADLVREVATLSKDIEHVKEIVVVQQSYARQCGATETLQMAELVEDAIRMNLGAFERHGVTLQKNFRSVPPISVDKHKVLQILINLMRNAKYAMDEQAPEHKILMLTIDLNPEGNVSVAVKDNGIGISKENLAQLFQHGFTTKKDGHGFGLYSGFLAARELGGRLSA